MTQPSAIKSFIAGGVGGALGASLTAGALGVLGGLSLESLDYRQLLTLLAGGAAVAVAMAFVYDKLPKSFFAKAILATVLMTAACWIGIFPQLGIEFSPKLATVSVVGNALFGVVATFVLHHAIGLALPHVPMPRRAEEFSDDPAGAH